MREKVERLKHHARAHAKAALLFTLLAGARGGSALDGHAVNADAAGIGELELVEAAQESALAAAARSNQYDGLAAALFVAHAIQHAVGVERFNKLFNGDHGAAFFRASWHKGTRGNLMQNKFRRS